MTLQDRVFDSMGRLKICLESCESCMVAGKDLEVMKEIYRRPKLVQLVCLGKSNKEIADALHISDHTVKIHMSRLFSKAGVKSRTELAAWVMAKGLL